MEANVATTKRDVAAEIKRLAQQRILVLDGAWGTMLQGAGLAPEDYRGERFSTHAIDVAGNPDVLNLTRPDLIRSIHEQYLDAGADITTTNTFTATSIGQADYALEDAVYEMNVAGARIAREAAGDRFVAGSIGPLNVALSLSPKVDDPSFRAKTFDQVKDAYSEQIAALREGGVDLLMFETIFDTLNVKAGIIAARETAPEIPLWISVTIVDLSGRTLSGQTLEAFWTSIEHAEPLIVGINCALGAKEMRPYVAELSRLAPCLVACHPNAGLPNPFGEYEETPEVTSSLLREFAEAGFLNIAGSCCGSTPAHTAAIAAAVDGLPPRPVTP
jgi:5-methyltetrahydrofolate--homocysteine methyltransferase